MDTYLCKMQAVGSGLLQHMLPGKLSISMGSWWTFDTGEIPVSTSGNAARFAVNHIERDKSIIQNSILPTS